MLTVQKQLKNRSCLYFRHRLRLGCSAQSSALQLHWCKVHDADAPQTPVRGLFDVGRMPQRHETLRLALFDYILCIEFCSQYAQELLKTKERIDTEATSYAGSNYETNPDSMVPI